MTESISPSLGGVDPATADRTPATPGDGRPLRRRAAAAPEDRHSLRAIAADLVQSRDLLYQLTLRDIRIRYKQAVMGFGWALFVPLLVVMAGLLVRYAMARASGQGLDGAEVAGMSLKAVSWAFFVGAIGFATPSLLSNMGLVTKIYFPREVLPLASILAQTFDTAIATAAILLLMPFLGVALTPALLWLPVMALLLFTFTAAAGFFLSCANLFFRDVKYLVQTMLTFGIFATPVLFEPAMFGPVGSQLLMLNPLSPMLEGLRLAAVEGHNLLLPFDVRIKGELVRAWHPGYLLYAAAWAFGGLLVSLRIFRRASTKFAEYI